MGLSHAAGLVLLAIAVLSGCSSPSDVAKQHFVKTFSCSEERVQVRARPELHFRQNLEWQDEVYEVRGCDYQTLNACEKVDKQSSKVICSPRSYAPGISKW